MGPQEWSLAGHGGSGAGEGSVNPLHKIGLPVQSVTVIIVIFSCLCCFSISIFDFIFSFYF